MKIRNWIAWLLAMPMLIGCGELFNFEDNDTIDTSSMTLNKHELNLMMGSKYVLTPIFVPDSISNEEVYWSSTNPAIVKLHNDTLIALMPGTCTIVATSVQRRLTDRCVVTVSHSWSFVPDGYRYDMVVYADITHDGRPIGEEFAVGAFYRDTLRGVARKRHDGGKDYYVIRIYSNQAKGEDITLNSYNAKTGEVKPVDFHIIFDGEAHGSLSAPVKISI